MFCQRQQEPGTERRASGTVCHRNASLATPRVPIGLSYLLLGCDAPGVSSPSSSLQAGMTHFHHYHWEANPVATERRRHPDVDACITSTQCILFHVVVEPGLAGSRPWDVLSGGDYDIISNLLEFLWFLLTVGAILAGAREEIDFPRSNLVLQGTSAAMRSICV